MFNDSVVFIYFYSLQYLVVMQMRIYCVCSYATLLNVYLCLYEDSNIYHKVHAKSMHFNETVLSSSRNSTMHSKFYNHIG